MFSISVLVNKIYQIRSAAAAVYEICCRVVVFRVVVGGDGARVVGREVRVVSATSGRLLRQDLDQLRQEVVRLEEPNLKKMKPNAILRTTFTYYAHTYKTIVILKPF